MNALLDKYADEGIVPIEDLAILNVQPISEIGTPIEIVEAFGGRDRYLQAIRELERQLYAALQHGEPPVSITTLVKVIQDIMRKDVGVDGDAQRISQMVWMLFLKIFDDREKEWELRNPQYKSPIPSRFRWRNWAANPEGMTGEELIDYVNNELFPKLKTLTVTAGTD